MSSKRRIRRRSCSRKVRHETADQARAAMSALTRTKGWTGHMQVYRCRFCGGYHFGHY